MFCVTFSGQKQHHSWNIPPPLLLIKGGTFQKLSHLGGIFFFCQKGRINNKPEKGRLSVATLFITLQFNHVYSVCRKSKVSFITIRSIGLLSQSCKILVQVFIILKHCIICIFLIHSGIVQKILTALFKLVQNTQKITRANFFEYQGKMFLNIEKVLVKISEQQP